MAAFWSHGYRGTSIEDLVGGTGVSRASLYAAYADKRALFIASVERYLDAIVQSHVRRLGETEPAGEAVRQFFLQTVEAPMARLRRGCLLTNSAVEIGSDDKEVAALIRTAFERVETVLCERLTQAKKDGALSKGLDPARYARQLLAVLQGLRVMARVGVGRDTLRDAVHSALAGIPQPRSRADRREVEKAPRRRAAQTRP